MNLDKKKVVLALFGVVFAIWTVWIHYEVKANLESSFGDDLFGALINSNVISVGTHAPNFSTVDLAGTVLDSSEFFNTEVVVMDFWATWCPPCIKGLPDLQDVHDEFGERGVRVLAVNVGEGLNQVQEFMDENVYRFAVAMDPERVISGLYGVGGIPQYVVIGKDGNVRHVDVGYPMGEGQIKKRKKHVRELLERLIQEQPSSNSPSAV